MKQDIQIVPLYPNYRYDRVKKLLIRYAFGANIIVPKNKNGVYEIKKNGEKHFLNDDQLMRYTDLGQHKNIIQRKTAMHVIPSDEQKRIMAELKKTDNMREVQRRLNIPYSRIRRVHDKMVTGV